jgi:D-sedoheptulose 7-phosphate isomerase
LGGGGLPANNQKVLSEARILEIVSESLALKKRFFAENARRLLEVSSLIADSLRKGGKVLAFGNGGSAADAQHFAGELVGRFLRERPGLSALALTTDPSVITALGNDYGFDRVFARQVEAHGRAGDVALAFSTSGNSQNVLLGLSQARAQGLRTVGLTGRGGGGVARLVDHLIDVPHSETPRIQEVHGMVVHLLCQAIEEDLFPG